MSEYLRYIDFRGINEDESLEDKLKRMNRGRQLCKKGEHENMDILCGLKITSVKWKDFYCSKCGAIGGLQRMQE